MMVIICLNMDSVMKNFSISFYALIVFGLSATALLASTTNPEDPENGSDARVAPAVIPVQCVFDFSPEKTKSSMLKMAAYLVSNGGVVTDDSPNTLYNVDMTYLMFESVAALVRKNSPDFPKLFELFSDTSSVYKAFNQLITEIDDFEDDLSTLADLKTCQEYVNYMLENDLPLLIDVLRQSVPLPLVPAAALADAHKAEIIKGAETFTPQIAELLNSSYIGLSKIAQTVSNDVPVVLKNNYKYLPYAALAVGAAGLFVAMLRGFGTSSSSSKK